MKTLYIPSYIFQESEQFLKRRGKTGKEGLVLWAGQKDANGRAYVLMCVKAGDSWPEGVRLRFPQMLKLTQLLVSNDMVLLAQVHNHPDNVPHSLGDEENPVSHEAGYISVVVSEMGLKGIDFRRCFVYEYQSRLQWRELSVKEKAQVFKILPDGFHL